MKLIGLVAGSTYTAEGVGNCKAFSILKSSRFAEVAISNISVRVSLPKAEPSWPQIANIPVSYTAAEYFTTSASSPIPLSSMRAGGNDNDLDKGDFHDNSPLTGTTSNDILYLGASDTPPAYNVLQGAKAGGRDAVSLELQTGQRGTGFPGGTYFFIQEKGTNKCLSTYWWSKTEGVQIQLWPLQSGGNGRRCQVRLVI